MLISRTEGYNENPWYLFLEESMLFLLAWKWNLQEKASSSVKSKANSNFAIKLAERSNHSFLLSVWSITFFKHLIMECIELNWLCKHTKKVRSSQPPFPVLNWVKHSLSLWASLMSCTRNGKSFTNRKKCFFSTNMQKQLPELFCRKKCS